MNLFCTHCESEGHTKDRCWKLHGYPPGHRLHNGGNSGIIRGSRNVIANNGAKDITRSDESTDRVINQLSLLKMSQNQQVNAYSQ